MLLIALSKADRESIVAVCFMPFVVLENFVVSVVCLLEISVIFIVDCRYLIRTELTPYLRESEHLQQD